MQFIVGVGIVKAGRGRVTTVGRVVGMTMKGPFQQEHREEPAENPAHGGVEATTKLKVGVRDQVEHADAEEDPASE